MAELAALEDPRAREVNERHGDDHGVNLTKLRAVATRLKTQQELARQLWETDDTAARLLALLICRRSEERRVGKEFRSVACLFCQNTQCLASICTCITASKSW